MSESPPIRRAALLGIDIELRAIRNAGGRFPPHWHDDLQVIATVRGSGEAIVEGRTYGLPERSLIVVPPRAVHTARAVTAHAWVFHSLHVPPDRAGGSVVAGAAPIHAPAGDRLHDAFNRVVAGLFDEPSDAVAAFADLVERIAARAGGARPERVPERLRAARDALIERLEGPLDLDALAAAHGYGRSRFDRLFTAYFFMPPYAWWLNARTEAAKRMLRAGESVGQAARGVGFANASQFSRHYRSGTGLTARAYATAYRRRART